MFSNQITFGLHNDLLRDIVIALTEGRDIEPNSSTETLDEKFYIEETLAPTDIKMTMNEAELSFPLSTACIEKLINVITTAKFGLGEKTVLDKIVCNTQMIDVVINQEALTRLTNNMQRALDFPTDSALTPHLYNMLIYGPDQFFNKHRDSEKLQNMVAKLEIILPSPHIGGDLIIEYGNKKHTLSTQNIDEKNAKCISFYFDCLHNVNKVQCGYRVALTYNIVLETGDFPVAVPCTNEELKAAVQDYFNTETVEDKPMKIVFLLNHTYTEHRLLWNLLKDEDGQYASSFRSVARELDLDIYLALANIRQVWEAVNLYESNWLIKTHGTLSCWVDENNVKLLYAEYLTTYNEICFAQNNRACLKPTREEFSRATGNTIDQWIKCAAIVLWRKSDSLMTTFEMNYDGAMAEVRTLISVPGNEENIMVILNKAAKFSQKGRPMRTDFETFVNAALYVKAKKEAQAILLPFHLDVLIPEHVHLLVQLQQQYGADWLIEVVSSLRHQKGLTLYESMVSEAINPFTLKFLNSDSDRSVIMFLLNAEVDNFKKCVRFYAKEENRVENTEQYQELFKACVTIGNVELQKDIVQFLISKPESFPRTQLIESYHELQINFSPEGSELFREYLVQGLKQELSSQTRVADDWSLSEVLPCNCIHCDALNDFLRSKTLTTKSWPVNTSIRNHVTAMLKKSGAPVQVNLDRTSKRPFSLVLQKKPTLYAESVKKCTELKAALQNLQPKSAAMKRESLMEYDDEKRQKL